MATISVVVPVYKAEKHLRQCLDSILAQTLSDLEIILVDDGSPDSSGQICDGYARKHPNIRVIHKENQGQTPARKDGLQAATGQYVSFVDSDDWLEPDMYEKMLASLHAHDADMVIAGYVEAWEDRNLSRGNAAASGVYRGEDLAALRQRAVWDAAAGGPAISLSLWTKLFRRDYIYSTFMAIPGALRFGEDTLCTWGLLANARCVVIDNDQRPYHYRCWEGSITQRYYPHYARDLQYLTEQLDALYGGQCADMDRAIAHYYISSLLHGVLLEGSRLNPAGFMGKCAGIRAFCDCPYLPRAMSHADLTALDAQSRRSLGLLAKKQAFSYLMCNKFRSLLAKLKRN